MDICCHLFGGKLCIDDELCDREPVGFAANLSGGATAGIKSFVFTGKTRVRISWRASLKEAGFMATLTPYLYKVRGKLELLADPNGPALSSIPLDSTAGDWESASCAFELTGTHPLYFRYTGKGAIDLRDLSFE